MNGLCVSIVIDAFALVYGPGPIIVCDGPLGERESMWMVVPELVTPHGRRASLLDVTAPPAAMLIRVAPAFGVIEVTRPVNESLRVKLKSLSSWAADSGLACKSVSMMVIPPVEVVSVADALTASPLLVDPAGVVNVIVAADAEPIPIAASAQAKLNL